MYALVTLLGLVSLTCWLQAFTTDARRRLRRGPGDRLRRRVRGDALHAQLGAVLRRGDAASRGSCCCGARGAARAPAAAAHRPARLRRRRCCSTRRGSRPTLYQAAHTGAPWSKAPSLAALASVPARILGEVAEVAVVARRRRRACVALLRAPRRGYAPGARSSRCSLIARAHDRARLDRLAALAGVGEPLPRGRRARRSCCSPPPGFAHAGRLGLVGLALVAVLWAIDGAPDGEEQRARRRASRSRPSLRPGDLVVATQPEQVPVLDYYLPDGLRYATLTGPVPRHRRDRLARRRRAAASATSAERDLRAAARLAASRASGSRSSCRRSTRSGRWSAPWTRLVRLRSEEWLQYVSNDPRLRPDRRSSRPTPFPASPNPVRARVYLKR